MSSKWRSKLTCTIHDSKCGYVEIQTWNLVSGRIRSTFHWESNKNRAVQMSYQVFRGQAENNNSRKIAAKFLDKMVLIFRERNENEAKAKSILRPRDCIFNGSFSYWYTVVQSEQYFVWNSMRVEQLILRVATWAFDLHEMQVPIGNSTRNVGTLSAASLERPFTFSPREIIYSSVWALCHALTVLAKDLVFFHKLIRISVFKFGIEFSNSELNFQILRHMWHTSVCCHILIFVR
jgi:hypothetical protein